METEFYKFGILFSFFLSALASHFSNQTATPLRHSSGSEHFSIPIVSWCFQGQWKPQRCLKRVFKIATARSVAASLSFEAAKIQPHYLKGQCSASNTRCRDLRSSECTYSLTPQQCMGFSQGTWELYDINIPPECRLWGWKKPTLN